MQAIIHRLYNQKLKEIEKTYTNKEMTYLDKLSKVGRKLLGTKFKGVFPSDKVPRLSNISPYCILNLDRSGEPGSHWIALVKFGKHSLVYDSFGRKGVRLIPHLPQTGNGIIIDSDLKDREQEIMEVNCGARCLAFLSMCDEFGVRVARHI